MSTYIPSFHEYNIIPKPAVTKIYHFEPEDRCNFMLFGTSGSGKSSTINTLGSSMREIAKMAKTRAIEMGQCTKSYGEYQAAEKVRFFDTWGYSGSNYTLEEFSMFLDGSVPSNQKMDSRLNLQQREGDCIIDYMLLILSAPELTATSKGSNIQDYRPFLKVCKEKKVKVFVIITKIDIWIYNLFKKNIKIHEYPKDAVSQFYQLQQWRDLKKTVESGLGVDEEDVKIFPIVNYGFNETQTNIVVEEFSQALVRLMTTQIDNDYRVRIQDYERNGMNESRTHILLRDKPENIKMFGFSQERHPPSVERGNNEQNIEIIGDIRGKKTYMFLNHRTKILELGNTKFRLMVLEGLFENPNETWMILINPDGTTFECVLYIPNFLKIIKSYFTDLKAPKYQFLYKNFVPHTNYVFQYTEYVKLILDSNFQITLKNLKKRNPIHARIENHIIGCVERQSLEDNLNQCVDNFKNNEVDKLRKITDQLEELKNLFNHHFNNPNNLIPKNINQNQNQFNNRNNNNNNINQQQYLEQQRLKNQQQQQNQGRAGPSQKIGKNGIHMEEEEENQPAPTHEELQNLTVIGGNNNNNNNNSQFQQPQHPSARLAPKKKKNKKLARELLRKKKEEKKRFEEEQRREEANRKLLIRKRKEKIEESKKKKDEQMRKDEEIARRIHMEERERLERIRRNNEMRIKDEELAKKLQDEEKERLRQEERERVLRVEENKRIIEQKEKERLERLEYNRKQMEILTKKKHQEDLDRQYQLGDEFDKQHEDRKRNIQNNINNNNDDDDDKNLEPLKEPIIPKNNLGYNHDPPIFEFIGDSNNNNNNNKKEEEKKKKHLSFWDKKIPGWREGGQSQSFPIPVNPIPVHPNPNEPNVQPPAQQHQQKVFEMKMVDDDEIDPYVVIGDEELIKKDQEKLQKQKNENEFVGRLFCDNCKHEISTSRRYHSQSRKDFDLCGECFKVREDYQKGLLLNDGWLVHDTKTNEIVKQIPKNLASKFATEIKLLKVMGWEEKAAYIDLLVQYDGNVDQVALKICDNTHK